RQAGNLPRNGRYRGPDEPEEGRGAVCIDCGINIGLRVVEDVAIGNRRFPRWDERTYIERVRAVADDGEVTIALLHRARAHREDEIRHLIVGGHVLAIP